MKMSKKLLKAVALVGCAVLLVAGSVAGTLAYLTSKTGPVTNTFTVGNVTITLDETKVDLYGATDAATARVTANDYKLIPGHEYVKDPTIHVAQGSEPCYLFVKITDELSAIQDTKTIVEQLTANQWTQIADTNVWYHNVVIDASQTAQDVPVFKSLKIKADAQVSNYANKTVSVIAYAVQKDGFDNALAAWSNTFSSENS